MRDQYVGDISDLLKYSLLRALSVDRQLGIAWYYNSLHDGRTDGRHTDYLREDKWLALDADVLAAMRGLLPDGDASRRSVADVEKVLEQLIPTVCFHRLAVPPRSARPAWAAGMAQQLSSCDLVFLDPDNGIGTENRHATVEEVRSLRRVGRAILIIKFPGRRGHEIQEAAHHENLRVGMGSVRIATLRTSVMVRTPSGFRIPSQRWFTLLDYDDALLARFRRFANVLQGIPGAKAPTPSGT